MPYKRKIARVLVSILRYYAHAVINSSVYTIRNVLYTSVICIIIFVFIARSRWYFFAWGFYIFFLYVFIIFRTDRGRSTYVYVTTIPLKWCFEFIFKNLLQQSHTSCGFHFGRTLWTCRRRAYRAQIRCAVDIPFSSIHTVRTRGTRQGWGNNEPGCQSQVKKKC